MTDLLERVTQKLAAFVPPRGSQAEHEALATDIIDIVLKEAEVIVGTLAERPYDLEPEFSAVLTCEVAIHRIRMRIMKEKP